MIKSLMISPLHLQQCPVCLTGKVLEMGSRCPYSFCFVGCYRQDLFNTAHSILVQLPTSFLSHSQRPCGASIL